VKKIFSSKLGNGKVVAEYLPAINAGSSQVSVDNSFKMEHESSIERKA